MCNDFYQLDRSDNFDAADWTNRPLSLQSSVRQSSNFSKDTHNCISTHLIKHTIKVSLSYFFIAF